MPLQHLTGKNYLLGGFMFHFFRTISLLLISYSLFHSVSSLAENHIDISKEVDIKALDALKQIKALKEMGKGKGIHVAATTNDEKGKPDNSKQIMVSVNSDSDGAPVEIIVPVAFFMTFPACLFLVFWFRFKSVREKQLTLRAMVENGANIPTEMFLEGKSKLSPIEKDRKNGILFTLSSVGLIVFLLLISTTKGLWAMGLVPLLLGIGYLLNWKLATKDVKQV